MLLKMKITIETFAMLKEYLSPKFEMNITNAYTIKELKKELQKINPASAELISMCRFSINNQFINEDKIIEENDTVFIIPPSSGG